MRRLVVRQLQQLAEQSSTFVHRNTIPSNIDRSLSSVAYEIDTLVAQRRADSGSNSAAKLRQAHQVPGVLFSLPDEESILLTFEQKEIATCLQKLGRTGWACHVFNVKVPPEDGAGEPAIYRALGRQVHMTAATDAIENVTLIHCPPDRRVRVNVPLKIYGEEVCPGLKAGGRINWIQRTIACSARGDAVPKGFEVDISHLNINDKLHYSDLDVPEGVDLAVKDLREPILKIMRK